MHYPRQTILLRCALVGLLLGWFIGSAFGQKIAAPDYTGQQIRFYNLGPDNLSINPAALVATLPTAVAGTSYNPNGVVCSGTDLLVTTNNGLLHYKGLQIADGVVTVVSAVRLIPNVVTTSIVADLAGNVYVGCGTGAANRGIQKFVRDANGAYSFSASLTLPAQTNTTATYSSINGLAFDTNGNLFATDLGDNRILKWQNATGTPISFSCPPTANCSFTDQTNQPTNLFSLPTGLALDPSGRLLVANNNGPNSPSPNPAGSLVNITSEFMVGDNITPGNTNIKRKGTAQFGGLTKIGNFYFVTDQQRFADGQDRGRIWQMDPYNFALTEVGIGATFSGTGQVAEVPAAVFADQRLPNPVVSGSPPSLVIEAGQAIVLVASGCGSGQQLAWTIGTANPTTIATSAIQNGNGTLSINESPIINTVYTAYCQNNIGRSTGTSVVVTISNFIRQAESVAVPDYNSSQVRFYDLRTYPAPLITTLPLQNGSGQPNGVAFFGTDMLVSGSYYPDFGFLHYKNVQLANGTISLSSPISVTTGTQITTGIVVDGLGAVYVGCGLGSGRVVKKFVRNSAGDYVFSANLPMPISVNIGSQSDLNTIGGLTFDGAGNLFATDFTDNRILKWTNATGTPAEFAYNPNSTFQNTARQVVYVFSLPSGLVFDDLGNLWIGNNNGYDSPTPNQATGGSLVKLSASLVSGAGGYITPANTTIYSVGAAHFGGLARVGSQILVNDEQNNTVWRLNTRTGELAYTGALPGHGGVGQQLTAVSLAVRCVLAANTAVSVQSGNWNDATTWQCGTIPGPGVVAQIKAGHTVLVGGTAQAKSVQFETGGKVQYSAVGGRVVLTP